LFLSLSCHRPPPIPTYVRLTGEHIEDFEEFEASSFVSRMLGKGNIAGLMEKMKVGDGFSDGNSARAGVRVRG
jgi:signal recognition particle GTPase